MQQCFFLRLNQLLKFSYKKKKQLLYKQLRKSLQLQGKWPCIRTPINYVAMYSNTHKLCTPINIKYSKMNEVIYKMTKKLR